ncbi:MAG: glucose 1-dehydrogenase [Dehalococcoidia bacterium]|nr:glucose 1-dehydrogenase [Dehalococcoidia bacterium]
MELEGKVAIVTGAGQGIGAAIAMRFAREGAGVVIDYVGSADDADAIVARLAGEGHRAVALPGDVSKRADVEALVAETVRRFGRVDVLVNNAGITAGADFLEMTDEDWDRVLDVDLRGTFLCTQIAARVMKEHGGGSVVNISSVHEDLPFPGFAQYCAAKGGMRMLMRALSLELAPYRIRVNNIAPGAIATARNVARLDDPAKQELLARVIPAGRMGTPDEVANVAVFLASDRASYVTGSTYYVDGGLVRHTEPV